MLTSNDSSIDTISNNEYFSRSVAEMSAARHSVRAFLTEPVSRILLEKCFEIAQKTPSNSNLQPWRVHVLEGPALQRVSRALQDAVTHGVEPTTLPIPDAYKPYRSQMGHALYGREGYDIPREDKERLEAARRRNYDFFGAPTALIVSMDRNLAPVDTLSIGFYLHTVCLLLAEQGVAYCYQVSVAGYPDVLRRELNMTDEMDILCGVAIGYEDKDHQINKLRIPRDDWTQNVRFVDT